MSRKKEYLLIALALALLFSLFPLQMLRLSVIARSKAEVDFEIFLGQGSAAPDALEREDPALVRFFRLEENRSLAFVLPGDWDPADLRIYLSGVDSVRIGGRRYRSGEAISLPAEETFAVKPKGSAKIAVTVRQTGGLPVLFIRTESGSSEAIHADKDLREPGTLLMTDAAGATVYEGALRSIRTRGNATFLYSKKPYQIKLEDSAALIEGRPGKTWILLANAIDRSQLRNRIAFDLAAVCGAFAYTPRAQSADLYLNGDYKGCYLLTEKVETAAGRLEIADLEKATEALNRGVDFSALRPLGDAEYAPGARKYYALPAEPEDLSGGYLILLSKSSSYETEASGFVTDRGAFFALQEPKYAGEAQLGYISALLQRIEDALYAEDGVDPASGLYYVDMLDLTSFVCRYLTAEVLQDFDGQYCYFYKDADAADPTLYAGPVWDQDNLLGLWSEDCDPAAIHVTEDCGEALLWPWYAAAWRHEDFRAAAREVYAEVFRPALLVLLGRETDPEGRLRAVDDYAREVARSAELDFLRWPDAMGTHHRWYNYGSGGDYPSQIRFMKEYLALRLETLDRFFLGEGA